MPLGRTSGPNPPNWGNDAVFFWTRVIDFIFILAVPGLYLIDEWAGLVEGVIQLAIEFSITSWLRRRRRSWWERSQRPGSQAIT